MIVCPNCSHQNPDGAAQCEACYTPLPTLASCPSCGASVQSNASFCGQCGFDLRAVSLTPPVSAPSPDAPSELPETAAETAGLMPASEQAAVEIPALTPPEPLITPEPIELSSSTLDGGEEDTSAGLTAGSADAVPPPINEPQSTVPVTPPPVVGSVSPPVVVPDNATQLQVNSAKLLHVQTDSTLELPADLPIIHMGKPNDRIPPVIDVSGFPNSEIVSRVHASIRVEGDVYYIEDAGSSNGTYINNMPLPSGNRHRLRPGDRIALGKGDKVSFLFQT